MTRDILITINYRQVVLSVIVIATLCLTACSSNVTTTNGQEQVSSSQYPVAVDIDKIGQYPAFTKSGGGYFYDEVLEYRAWIHPELGGEDIYDGDDYYQAFATYEEARDFSRKTMGAEEPVVLVVQYEWIDEPEPGTYIVMKKERLTEWLVEWLEGNKRGVNSISDFIDERTAKDTQ